MLGKDKKREEKLMELMQYRFAVVETALYLDTHPNDCDVLERHNYFAKKAMEMQKEYEMEFNDPLCIFSQAECYWTYQENMPFGRCGGKCN